MSPPASVRLAAVAALAATTAAGPAAAAPPAASPVVEAARQVTADADPTRLYTIPAVAVSPTDPNTVVIGAGDYRNGGCGLWVSRDGGLSWANTTRTLLPQNLTFCPDRNFGKYIDLAFTPNGETLYVGTNGAPREGFPNGPQTAVFSRTDDLGVAVDTTVVAEPGPVEVPADDGTVKRATEQFRHASVAVDPTNPKRVYMGWRLSTTPPADHQGFVNGIFSIYPTLRSQVAVSEDGGRTWSAPVDLTAIEGAPAGTDIPYLVVDGDGTARAFMKARPPRPSDPAAPRPVAGVYMFTSTDRGATWSVAQIDEGAAAINPVQAAVDRTSGRLYVAFDKTPPGDGAASSVFVMASGDAGATWSEPVPVVDPASLDTADQSFPGLSVSPDGRVDVAWFDFRSDRANPKGDDARLYDVYGASSRDGGATWSPNFRISDRSIDAEVGISFAGAQRGPVGVAATDSAMLVTWADSRAGDAAEGSAEDAYFTRVRMGPVTVAAAGDGGVDAAGIVLGAGGALALAGLLLLLARRPRTAPPTAS